MPLHLGWSEIAIRLTLTVMAGALVGFDRGEHGRPAGLRTTLLVALAAAISMIQANLLLATAGRPADSFISMDLMRLPLGILTGMGFIGGGAILKKGDMVRGVTTAATLWFMTMIGLCFGGGQHALGIVALAIGFFVISVLKHVEAGLPIDRRSTLIVSSALNGPSDIAVGALIEGQGFRVTSTSVTFDRDAGKWTHIYELQRRSRSRDISHQNIVRELALIPEITQLTWSPQ